MNTKIDGIGASTGALRVDAQARRPAGSATQEVGAVSAAAPLRLDNDSVELRASRELAGSSPGFDGARVEALRTAIESGNYTIDARAIAGRLMEIEGALQ
ncbi:MAG: flagellar biosynthesis anti-sigma factor FlgM [Aquimonas sp.]|nr:flagellar biosynthesis anti-sigma factor FlgM [Aquimonas sp.]